jgi:hypothetical protein
MQITILKIAILVSVSWLLPANGQGQQQAMPSSLTSLRFLSKLDSKVTKLEASLTRETEKSLKRLKKQEAGLRRRLFRKDSAAAKRLFDEGGLQYDELLEKAKTGGQTTLEGKIYDARLDTLSTVLRFLEAQQIKVADKSALITQSKAQLSKLEGKFDYTEQIKRLIKDRQAKLKNQLSEFGLSKSILKYSKTAHYYGEQVKEYRSLLNNSEKLEQKFLATLRELPAFKDFMQKHSAFASMFPLPTGGGTLAPGTQTIEQLQQLMQAQAGAAGQSPDQFMQAQLQGAEKAATDLKEKLLKKIDGGSGGGEQPDFKPNDEKTKSLWKRLELGTNLQTVKSNNFFPSTTDIGLSLGYKLSSKGIVGIGASYKLGWGNGIKDIRLTHEGIGLRSFIDWKLKGSFYMSGGYEQNHRASFKSLAELNGLSSWQQSGLLGISKIVSLKAKLFRKTKAQLFWDFLSYRAVPRTEPIKFRLGYNF